MTAEDLRRAWYRELSMRFGGRSEYNLLNADDDLTDYRLDQAVYYARLAAHFGRLALGQTEYPIADVYRDWLNARDTSWAGDCLYWRGRMLTGKQAHWCADWDDLPMDETCPEWPCPCETERGA